MQVNQLRQAYIDFFVGKGHRHVASASLVPAGDKTLLFTNAGMVPFKEMFLGQVQPPATTLVSAQRCMRAGGKHNDLENVGYTQRHQTCFEMLGNFSFGEYFKEQAIAYAWEFVTKELKLPEERLWVSVHHNDDESRQIWREQIGVPAERIGTCGDEDNFWAMGDVGPCGYCSEIFYDRGPSFAGDPPGGAVEGERYIELWNLVFMQFMRSADGSMADLPQPCVDTGMGLERVASILQDVPSNFDIDNMSILIHDIAELFGVKADCDNPHLRVVADHCRAMTLLVADGVLPSNEGRGYVLRRIMRRASRHAHALGNTNLFMAKMVQSVVATMTPALDSLADTKVVKRIQQVVEGEETQFAETLERGMQILEKALKNLQSNVIDGELVFQLYDTYGFPVDMTQDIARERSLEVDYEGYEAAMSKQRARSSANTQFAGGTIVDTVSDMPATEFLGYQTLSATGKVLAIWQDGTAVQSIDSTATECWFALDRTPFYAESGGQDGDIGAVGIDKLLLHIDDCQKQGDVFLHRVAKVEGQGELRIDSEVHCHVDRWNRRMAAAHHSATHLMYEALRKVLGDDVGQRGSSVGAHSLRFDFNHPQPVTTEQIRAIEDIVNEQILLNAETETQVMPLDVAIEQGAKAFFDEKYGDEVRVLTIGDDSFSKELCGGTHVRATGDIGIFRITGESSIASGVRRLEAVVGKAAHDWLYQREQLLSTTAEKLQVGLQAIPAKIAKLMSDNSDNAAKLAQIQQQLAASNKEQQDHDIGAECLLRYVAVAGINGKQLRELSTELEDDRCIVVAVASDDQGRGTLVVWSGEQMRGRVTARAMIQKINELAGGKGGGNEELARGGGVDVNMLAKAVPDLVDWAQQQ